MNLIKTNQRNSMKTKTLNNRMRLSMMKNEDIYAFDFTRASRTYTEKYRRCDDGEIPSVVSTNVTLN